jgi:hypothetical protein
MECRLPELNEGSMLTTRVRILLVCFTLAALSACSSSSPTTPSPSGSSVVMTQGQTVTPPGTPLRLSLVSTYIWGSAAIECVAGAVCNFSPSATVHAEAPGVAPAYFQPHIPNPMGGETFAYGGYVVRVTGFDPAWDERAPLDASAYKVLVTVTGQ